MGGLMGAARVQAERCGSHTWMAWTGLPELSVKKGSIQEEAQCQV